MVGLFLFFVSLISIDSQAAQLFFDTEQLVVFRHTVRTTQRPGLDLSAVGRNGNVGDRSVFRLTGTV